MVSVPGSQSFPPNVTVFHFKAGVFVFSYWGMKTVTLTACQMPSAARYATLIQSENVPHSA